jgi:hypothetical protein
MGAALMTMALVGHAAGQAQTIGDMQVTVTYKAKDAKVDDTTDILVFLFDHTDPTGESQPLGMQAVKQNGGTATFTGLPDRDIYVYVVYDEKGSYDGMSGPPPVGTPIGMYSKDGKVATPVKPGAKIKLTFNDARRWGTQ